MVLDLASKAVKAIATGNAQASLGAQSPELPSGIDRLGRFAYTFSALWLGVTLYTAYANTRVPPGTGPTLVLPGMSPDGGYGPARPDPQVSGLLGKLGGSSNSNSGGAVNDPALGANVGPIRTRIVRVALQMVGQTRFHYAEVRPIPSNILANPDVTDCSGFVTQVYMTAGAPDPNGLGYAKPLQGDTATMERHGTPVKTPNLGDLAFWSNPDHVCIVTGVNPVKVTGFGSNPAPVTDTKSQEDGYHASFVGYRSYT